MQIVCPACTAAYEVPPTRLKPGQAVRCARCAREWVPSPDAPEAPMDAPVEAKPAAAAAPLPPPPEPEVIPPAPRPRMLRPSTSRANVVLLLAWAASIVAVLLLAWGAYAERSAIMRAWPPSIRLYAALGLTGDH
jgi:predicted Zn finger-like uncharacterized protein